MAEVLGGPLKNRYDCIVVGGGSGGFGAALAAARGGCETLLIERSEGLGGTAQRGGVHTWEPVAGATAFPFEIYQRLKRLPDAVGIYSKARHFSFDGPGSFPGGENLIDPALGYKDTLRRHGAKSFRESQAFIEKHWHGVVFEPEPYEAVLREMLAETGRCTVALATAFRGVEHDDGFVSALSIETGERIEGGAFVDATGGGLLCQTCGCAVMQGQEARSVFDEPAAPDEANPKLNAATLVFRVDPIEGAVVEPLPYGVPAECWWRPAFPPVVATQYPRGGYCINMLPTMEGAEMAALGRKAGYDECRRRVSATWHDIQTRFPEFQRYRLAWVAPMAGVRESTRITGEKVLTEHDVRAGLSRQTDPDVITLSDHALDRHGGGSHGTNELAEPYGVPFRCLIPKGFKNLLIACRGASFSSVAASSCRLSRTMMQLGHAAGAAISLARTDGYSPADTPPERLREVLHAQHVQLGHPMPAALKAYLQHE